MVGKAVRGRARWAVVALLSALVVSGAVAPGARASSPGPAPAGGARHCRTVQVPVTIPGTSPGEVTGDLCRPVSGPRSNTALLLVAGGGENADYWNEPALPSYSLVKTATAAGYTTFAIDRLGTGRSTLPAPSTLVTYAAQVSTVHQVAQALRDDPAVFGRKWRTVVGIGHSLGSGTLAGVAASYPGDLDAVILTGYGAKVTPQTSQLVAIYQKPAATVNPARWGSLDSGYVTVVPSGVLQVGSLYPPDTTRAAVAVAARTQGTLSTTELSTRPQGAAATAQAAKITVPVLAADGQYDRHYCESNAIDAPVTIAAVCASQPAFYTYERALLPNACLATSIVADSGHAIQLEVAAPRANREFLAWLHATLSGRAAHCAVSGAYPPAAPR